MELLKKKVHMNRLKSHITTDITLEDDLVIADSYEDICRVITKSGDVITNDIKLLNGKAVINGSFNFRFLYSASDSNRLHQYIGSIPFSESVNTDDCKETDNICVKWSVNDISIDVINSRKISLHSILTLSLSCEEIVDLELSTMPECDDDVICLEKEASITMLAVNKKDILRIREPLTLSLGKPNIGEIVWESVSLKAVSTKVLNDAIKITGEIAVFILYNAEGDNLMLQWMDSIIPFSKEIPTSGCTEDMIDDIDVVLSQSTITIKNDDDGELRVFEPDILFDISILLYKDETCLFLSDAYSTGCNVVPTYSNISYNTLVIKNLSRCRTVDRLKLDLNGGQILQILSSFGYANIEETAVCDEGIFVDGAVTVKIMFICSDDKNPISIVDEIIPFSHTIEAGNVDKSSLIFIRPAIDVLSVIMTGQNALEVKADILLNCLVLGNSHDNIISDLSFLEFTKDEQNNRPDVVAYLPSPEDTLWSVSKKFHTTGNSIISLNELNPSLSFNDHLPDSLLLIV